MDIDTLMPFQRNSVIDSQLLLGLETVVCYCPQDILFQYLCVHGYEIAVVNHETSLECNVKSLTYLELKQLPGNYLTAFLTAMSLYSIHSPVDGGNYATSCNGPHSSRRTRSSDILGCN